MNAPAARIMIIFTPTLGCSAYCGPDDPGTAACPLDECAESCGPAAIRIECCLAAHGYGIAGEDLAKAEELCPSCDTSGFVSAESARCIAQTYGLPVGVAACAATIELPEPDTLVWAVYSAEAVCSTPGVASEELEKYNIDPENGALKGSEGMILDCSF